MIDYEAAKKVLALLNHKHLTLGAVESLTGGLFSSTICSIPGASAVFKGSLVTYSASEKEKLLGIDPKLIEEKGVVSKEVAHEMALKGKTVLGVDVVVSFTGNAGPTKEEGQAPVGRVNMALAMNDDVLDFEENILLPRNEMREECVNIILQKIIKNFEKN